MKRWMAWLAAGVLACGGGEAPEQAATEVGPDTLPASIPALEVEGGFVLVTPERVREWQTGGEPVVIVDARDAVQFGREHIPEAVNVPYVDIRAGANLPPLDSRIVLYCSDKDCPISQYAYEALRALGYTDLYDMRAGIQGWKDAGYPTVIGEVEES
jgi:rhodanese-related sulfurtransferase